MANLAELVVQGIVTASGGGAVVATLNAYFSRRTTQAAVAKVQVETGRTAAEITGVGAGTANIQVDTSLKLMQWMDGQLDDLRADLAAARAEAAAAREEAATARAQIDALRSWRRRQEALNAAHSAWDALVSERLAEAGITVPEPPPLTAAD